MKSALLSIVFSFFSVLFAFAQKNDYIKVNAAPSVSKELTFADSMQVRELFLEGLQDKIGLNYPKAFMNFEKALKMDPNNHAVLFELAYLHFEENNLMQAEIYLKKAVSIKSDNQWYWILLADSYKRNNKITLLIPVLNEILKLVPDQESYYYDRANAYLTLNDVDNALASYREIENKFGSSNDLYSVKMTVLMQYKKYDELEKELDKQIVKNPKDVRNYIYLSEIISKSDNRIKAIEVLNKAKNQFPSNSMLALALADQYTAINQLDNAFTELKMAFEDAELNIDEKVRIVLSFFPKFADEQAMYYANQLSSIMVKIHPEDAKAHALMGDVFFQDAKYQEAKISYKKALELNDQVYQIWEQLLRIELNIGTFEELVKDGNMALSIFPNQAALYLYTGIGYAQLKNHDRAIAFLKAALDLEPSDKEILIDIYSNLGDSFNALKNFLDSDNSYNQALIINPNNFYVLNNYAYYLSLRGERLEEAEKMSRKSLDLDPNNPSLEDTYGWILFKMKRYAEAKKWIEKSLQGKPNNNATQLEHYGDILYFLGNELDALKQWEIAKSRGGTSEKLNRKINEKKYID
jgi:tetratricopeptide (TPR) repeat protein